MSDGDEAGPGDDPGASLEPRAKVARLDDALANQIAAGEVVERPASAVKELVENALDAGATRVFVDVEEGGRDLVRVVDDGHGMAREDAVLAMERHATSKIATSEDLVAIGTLGFRGEALPSIASVSRFTLRTRTQDDEVGTEIHIDGGGPLDVRDVGCPVGTRIEVRALFHNVPARLKFLKRRATEMAHVHALMTAFALGQPHVRFKLTHNGRTTLDHPVAPNLKQRIVQVLGSGKAEGLFEVRGQGPVQVRGYVGEPSLARGTRDGVHTFVNGRSVRDRVVTHAVTTAYGDLLERGRHPIAVLYVHLPPDEVDVNVHPAKAEVRFAHASQVHEAIVRACRVTLGARPWEALRFEARHRPLVGRGESARVGRPAGPLPLDQYGLQYDAAGNRPRRPTSDGARASQGPAPSVEAPAPPAAAPLPAGHASPLDHPLGERAGHRGVVDEGPPEMSDDGPPRDRALVFEAPRARVVEREAWTALADAPSPAQTSAPRGVAAEGAVAASLVGVTPLGLAVTEDANGVHLVHLGRAREAVATHRLEQALAAEGDAGTALSQPLLMPAAVDVDRARTKTLIRAAPVLEALGMAVEPFGGSTWQVLSMPAALVGAAPERVLADVLARVQAAGDDEATRRRVVEALALHATPTGELGAPARVLEALWALPGEFGVRARRACAWTVGAGELRRRFGGGAR